MRQRSRCFTTGAVGALAALQHLLRQIDAAARAVELVAEQQIGRAGGETEAAVHAGAQDVVGFAHCGSASAASEKLVSIVKRLRTFGRG